MKRKRLKNEKIYRNKKRGVEELKMYIQFVRERTEDSGAGSGGGGGR